MASVSDPYATLGVDPSASDAEVRAAYRRLVQRHHPDHNNGSPDSARRFEAVQEAYAAVRRMRQDPGAAARAAGAPRVDPDLDARLAEMERELKAARDARERAVRAARRAQEQARRDARDANGAGGAAGGRRPTDEELGYFSTDDSFTKILDDAAAELSERWSEARRSPAAHRVSDLIDELAAKLTGEPPDRR
ncbi:MAG TPA: J domain-containing protein [Solirubrobacteraceae bacterium]|nr:J domain-containing protein [Solirubrobacteraceae bacterium]